MKNRIIIIVLCSLLCIVLGLTFALMPKPEAPEPELKDPLDKIIPVISFDNVKSIYIKNPKDEFTLENVDGSLVLDGMEHLSLNNYKILYLLSNTCQTYYTYTNEASTEDLEKYGLSEGEHTAEFRVETLDGNSYTIYIGNETLANDGYYARVPDRDAIFVLGYDIENDILGTSEYLLDTTLVFATDMQFYYLVDDFTLVKDGEDFVKINFVNASDRSELAAMGIQRLTYPEGYFASDYYNSVLQKFTLLDEMGRTNFMVSEVYTYNVDEEALEEYGISTENPAYLLTFSSPVMNENGEPVAKLPNLVAFSEKMRDENGAYYYNAYSLYKGFIGRVEAITVDFLEWELDKWVSPYLFQINIMSVDSISFDSKNGFYDFKLSGATNEELTVRETTTNYTADIKNFRNLWQTMLVVTHDGYCDLEDEEIKALTSNPKNHLLTMKVVTRGGLTQEYSFYQYTDQRVYYTINGGGEFYLPITMVNKIIADVDRFMNGELIDPEARY